MPEIPIDIELEGDEELEKLRERIEKLKDEAEGGTEQLGKLADNLDKINRQVAGNNGFTPLVEQTTLLDKGLKTVNKGLEETSEQFEKLDEDTKNTVRVIASLTGGIATLFTTIQGVRKGRDFVQWLAEIRTEGSKPWEVISKSAKDNLDETVRELGKFRAASASAFEATSERARQAWTSFFDLFRHRAASTADAAEATFRRSAQAAETASRSYRAAADEAARFTSAATSQAARTAGTGSPGVAGPLARRTASGVAAPGGALTRTGTQALTTQRQVGPFTGEFKREFFEDFASSTDDAAENVRRFLQQLGRLDGALAGISRWLKGVAVEYVIIEAIAAGFRAMGEAADEVEALNLQAVALRRTVTELQAISILGEATETDARTYLELIERLESGIGGLSIQLGGGRTAGDDFKRVMEGIGVTIETTSEAFEKLPEIAEALRGLPDAERFQRLFQIFGRDISTAAIVALDKDLRSATEAMAGFTSETDRDVALIMEDWDRAGEAWQGLWDGMEVSVRRATAETKKALKELGFVAIAGAADVAKGLAEALPESVGRQQQGASAVGGLGAQIPERTVEEMEVAQQAAEVGYAREYLKSVGLHAVGGAVLGAIGGGPAGAVAGAVALGPVGHEGGVFNVESHRKEAEVRDMRAQGVTAEHVADVRSEVQASTGAVVNLEESFTQLGLGSEENLIRLARTIGGVREELAGWVTAQGELRENADTVTTVMYELLGNLMGRYEEATKRARDLAEAQGLLATADERRDAAQLSTLTGEDAINRSLELQKRRLMLTAETKEEQADIVELMRQERDIASITVNHFNKLREIEQRRSQIAHEAQMGVIGVTRGPEGEEQIARSFRDANIAQAEMTRDRLGGIEDAKVAEDQIAAARRQYELDVAMINRREKDAIHADEMARLGIEQQHQMQMIQIEAERGKEKQTIELVYQRQRDHAEENYQLLVKGGLEESVAGRQRGLEILAIEREEEASLAAFRRQKREEEQQARLSGIQSEVAMQQRLIELNTRPGGELASLQDITRLRQEAAQESYLIHRNEIQLQLELQDITRQGIVATAELQKRYDDEEFQRRQEVLQQEIQIRQQITAMRQNEQAYINENFQARIQYAKDEFEHYGNLETLQKRIQDAYLARQSEIIDMETRSLQRIQEAAGGVFDAMLMRGKRGVEEFFRGQLLVMVRQLFTNLAGEIFGSLRKSFNLGDMLGGQTGPSGGLNIAGRLLSGVGPLGISKQDMHLGDTGLEEPIRDALMRGAQGNVGLGASPEALRQMSETFREMSKSIADMVEAQTHAAQEAQDYSDYNRHLASASIGPVTRDEFSAIKGRGEIPEALRVPDRVAEIITPEGMVTAEHREAVISQPVDEALATTMGAVRDTSTVLAQTNRGLQFAIEQLTGAIMSMAGPQMGIQAISEVAGGRPVVPEHPIEVDEYGMPVGTPAIPGIAPIQIQAPSVEVIAPQDQPIRLEAAETVIEEAGVGFGRRLQQGAQIAAGAARGPGGLFRGIQGAAGMLLTGGPSVPPHMAEVGRILSDKAFAELLAEEKGVSVDEVIKLAQAADYSVPTRKGAGSAGATALRQKELKPFAEGIIRGAAIGFGAYQVAEGLGQGGTQGYLQAASGGLAIASAIPGPHAPFTAAGAAALSVVSMFAGPDPAKRQEEIQNWLTANKYDPDKFLPYNPVITMSGQEVDYDFQGNMRELSGEAAKWQREGAKAKLPPGVVDDTPTPGINVSINALDSKSIMDNRAVLADAVTTAVKQGHSLGNEIDYRATMASK